MTHLLQRCMEVFRNKASLMHVSVQKHIAIPSLLLRVPIAGAMPRPSWFPTTQANIVVKYLRCCDWPFRNYYLSRLRMKPRYAMLVDRIEKLMGPDELLAGKNTAVLPAKGAIIQLPDKNRYRQSTLHEFFQSVKKAPNSSKKKTMRQLTLHTFFKKR